MPLVARDLVTCEASLSFLGFVTTPVPLPAYSTDRVLVTEWAKGHVTSNLNLLASDF